MPDPDIDHLRIEKLAYQLWQERGCPGGSADEDWRNAEQRLHLEHSSDPRLMYSLNLEPRTS